jgi:penicillin-binding protein 1A
MADKVGLDKVAEVVKRFAVNDNPQKIYSLVLGSTETTVLRMATAYAMMVNGGKKISPAFIEKIQDRNGKIIYRLDRRNCQNCTIANEMPQIADDRQIITDPATAYQITSMLQSVVERGTAARARSIGKIVGGKTGTTNNSIDSWFVGFSPDLVMAVYIGFDNPKTLGKEETGSSVSLPIFINFMKEALKNTQSTPFRIPSDIKFEKIDRTTGKYPAPETPKEHIISEALKLNDQISEEIISDSPNLIVNEENIDNLITEVTDESKTTQEYSQETIQEPKQNGLTGEESQETTQQPTGVY